MALAVTPSFVTSAIAFSVHTLSLMLVSIGLVLFNHFPRTRCLQYKMPWNNRVAGAQLTVILCSLLYTLLKIIQATVGHQSAVFCHVLCKLSALTFPLIGFSVLLFLILRAGKTAAGETRHRRLLKYILFGSSLSLPVIAVLNYDKGAGTVSQGQCVTTPNVPLAFLLLGVDTLLNLGYLALFVNTMRGLVVEGSDLDSANVRRIAQRNLVGCVLVLLGSLITNFFAALTSVVSSDLKPWVNPYVTLGPVMIVTGALYPTWSAWEVPRWHTLTSSTLSSGTKL